MFEEEQRPVSTTRPLDVSYAGARAGFALVAIIVVLEVLALAYETLW